MEVCTIERWGFLEVHTKDCRMEISIDTDTGGVAQVNVTEFDSEVSIQEFASFVNKARTEYNKLVSKKKTQEFIEGGE